MRTWLPTLVLAVVMTGCGSGPAVTSPDSSSPTRTVTSATTGGTAESDPPATATAPTATATAPSARDVARMVEDVVLTEDVCEQLLPTAEVERITEETAMLEIDLDPEFLPSTWCMWNTTNAEVSLIVFPRLPLRWRTDQADDLREGNATAVDGLGIGASVSQSLANWDVWVTSQVAFLFSHHGLGDAETLLGLVAMVTDNLRALLPPEALDPAGTTIVRDRLGADVVGESLCPTVLPDALLERSLDAPAVDTTVEVYDDEVLPSVHCVHHVEGGQRAILTVTLNQGWLDQQALREHLADEGTEEVDGLGVLAVRGPGETVSAFVTDTVLLELIVGPDVPAGTVEPLARGVADNLRAALG